MFKKLFGTQDSNEPSGNAAAVQEPVQYAPGTQISYDPQLIARFKGHHGSLLKLFGTIKQRAEAGDYAIAVETIGTFKRVLQDHLLEENIRFYTYLKSCLQKEEENGRLMNAMKLEMEGIGRVVTRFISHYLEFASTSRTSRNFSASCRSASRFRIGLRARRARSTRSTTHPAAT